MLISKLVPFRDGVFIGGAANALVNLSRALVETGHTVSIVAGSPEPGQETSVLEALSWAQVEFVPSSSTSPGRRGFQASPGMFLRAARVCRRNGADVVHGHSGYAHWAGLAAIVGRATGRPAVHTLYCPLADKIEDRRHPLMNARLARLCLSAADRVIAISSNVRRSLIAAGMGSDRIAVIPPPINDQRFSPHADGTVMRQQLGLGADEQMVLFVGNLTQTKGLDVLLKAIQALLVRWPHSRLVYTVERGPSITDEREKAIRELIASLGLGDRIVELGIVKDMPALMAASHVFVVPYRSTDGPSDYPVAMLEAMAVGRPVVATRVGAIPEIIGHGQTGVLVAPDDPADLARGIAAVLSAPSQARAMGKAGARIVRERFGSAKVAQATEQLYLEVLKQKTGRHVAGE